MAEGPSSNDEWIALVSGLHIGSSSASEVQMQMLVEYLVGEQGAVKEQASAARISRLIIVGNSLDTVLPPAGVDNGNWEQRAKSVSAKHLFDAFMSCTCVKL